MECIKCDYDFSQKGRILDQNKNWFDLLGDEINRPECGAKYILDYDETYNEETGEEFGLWNLSEV